MCIGQAFNSHTGREVGGAEEEIQWMVAVVSEMIHIFSLVHDDVLDQEETRRGQVSVNLKWGGQKSIMAGTYIYVVAIKLLARTGNHQVIEILSRVLQDLVHGELMQLQTTHNLEDRLRHSTKHLEWRAVLYYTSQYFICWDFGGMTIQDLKWVGIRPVLLLT